MCPSSDFPHRYVNTHPEKPMQNVIDGRERCSLQYFYTRRKKNGDSDAHQKKKRQVSKLQFVQAEEYYVANRKNGIDSFFVDRTPKVSSK